MILTSHSSLFHMITEGFFTLLAPIGAESQVAAHVSVEQCTERVGISIQCDQLLVVIQ